MSDERKSENVAVLASRAVEPSPARITSIFDRQSSEPAHKRLQRTIEDAKALNIAIRDLGVALAGGNPAEQPVTTRRANEKGFFAGLDAQASEIEQALESARVAVENIRRLI